MAGTIKELESELKSLKKTEKIIHVTELTTLSKIGKILRKAENATAYKNIILNTLQQVRERLQINSSFTNTKPAIILITSNKGFCGSYNQNIYRKLDTLIEKFPNAQIISIGKQGYQYIMKKELPLLSYIDESLENISLSDVSGMIPEFMNYVDEGKIDSVYCVYTEYHNVSTTSAEIIELFPNLPQTDKHSIEDFMGVLDVEEDIEEMEAFLIENYFSGLLYSLFLYSVASEYTERKIAMGVAKKNIETQINDTTTTVKKVTRNISTNELLSIISTAEVLEEEK